MNRQARASAERFSVRWGRRAVTLPAFGIGAVLAIGLLPLTLPAAWLADALRGAPGIAVRAVALVTFYLSCEALGILASFGAWVATLGRPATAARWNRRLELWWARLLFGGARWLFDLSLEVEGTEALESKGPLLLLPRHASLGDTLLPSVLVTGRNGIHLRHVMKRELLWDPCLDLVGQRLPHLFVRRDSAEGEAEIATVRGLAADLTADEGILLYAEGTRFTPEKRERVSRRIERSGDARLQLLTRRLRHVLPPRLGGTLALLEAGGLDVVFCAHVGFEGARSLADLWNGAMVKRRLRVRFWRTPRAEVPRGREEQVDWLYENWLRIDDWIDEALPGSFPVASNVASEHS